MLYRNSSPMIRLRSRRRKNFRERRHGMCQFWRNGMMTLIVTLKMVMIVMMMIMERRSFRSVDGNKLRTNRDDVDGAIMDSHDRANVEERVPYLGQLKEVEVSSRTVMRKLMTIQVIIMDFPSRLQLILMSI